MKAMSVVRFTPDGKLLAAGSHDGHVYLYDVLNNFKLKAKTVRGRKRESFSTARLADSFEHLDCVESRDSQRL